MFKKIALASAIAASASFATWDYFPVLDNHSGQVEVGYVHTLQGDFSAGYLHAGARFTVIPNLELALGIPYALFTDYDGYDGPDGLMNMPIMVRYQFMPTMNAFLDLTLPTSDDELNNAGIGGLSGDGFGFYFGVQYSQNFGAVNLGSELGFQMQTQGDDKFSAPYELHLGAEADFVLGGMVTPYVGIDLYMWVGEPTLDGESQPGSDYSGTLGFEPFVGLNVAFNQMIALDVSFRMGIGEDMYGDDIPMNIDGSLQINF
ncbi:MAG: transporter [Fibrobacter sp.]|nr:transporter [Fibrobacter sp.]